MLAGISGGWPQVLSNLKTLLETGRALPRVPPQRLPVEPELNAARHRAPFLRVGGQRRRRVGGGAADDRLVAGLELLDQVGRAQRVDEGLAEADEDGLGHARGAHMTRVKSAW